VQTLRESHRTIWGINKADIGRPVSVALFAFSLFLSGCTAKLAPDYDQALANGLSSANKDMETLFAAVGKSTGPGVDSSTYSKREDQYNNVIGSLNALAAQSKLRPAGSVTISDVNAQLDKLGIGLLNDDPNIADIPSARSLKDAADTITHMRDADKGSGLHGKVIDSFENQAETFVNQAIAYESFLKR
jgi:hypothetical protein